MLLADESLASAYLRALPDGLDSYRDCSATLVHDGVRTQLARPPSDELPAPLSHYFRGGWVDAWMPEVVGLTAQMMLADAMGEQMYLRWFYDEARRIYDRPVVRHLMRVVSPTLVVMGGAHRWGWFHRGSTLTALPVSRGTDRTTSRIVLRYPSGLFPALFCRALGESFRAALDVARGSAVECALTEYFPDHAIFDLAWSR